MDFSNWFFQNGGYLHRSAELIMQERGHNFLRVRPGCSISSNETIISCPHKLALSLKNLAGDGLLLDGSEWPNTGSLSRSTAFRLKLMTEYIHGETSFWWPYIDRLPQPCDKDSFGTPLYFSPEDKVWLKGTNLDKATSVRESNWRDEYDEVVKALEGMDEGRKRLWTLSVFPSHVVDSIMLSDHK